jgi:hypothetical protein
MDYMISVQSINSIYIPTVSAYHANSSDSNFQIHTSCRRRWLISKIKSLSQDLNY